MNITNNRFVLGSIDLKWLWFFASQVLSFPVVLHGIKITSGFKADEVHVQFQNSPVRVELKSPPSQIPHEVNIHFANTTYSEDLASILVAQNMATRI